MVFSEFPDFWQWVHIVVVYYQESSVTPKFYIKPTSQMIPPLTFAPLCNALFLLFIYFIEFSVFLYILFE